MAEVNYGLKGKIDERATAIGRDIKSALPRTTYYPVESEEGADALALLQFLWDEVEPSRPLYLAVVDAWKLPGNQRLIADCEANAGTTLMSIIEEVAPVLMKHQIESPWTGANILASKYEANQDVLSLFEAAGQFMYLTLNSPADRENGRARITLERSLKHSSALIGAILFKSMTDSCGIDLERYEALKFVGPGGQRVLHAIESQPNDLDAADRRLKAKIARRARKWGRLHHADTKYKRAKQFYYCRVEPVEPIPDGLRSLMTTYLEHCARNEEDAGERRLRRNIEPFDFLTGYRSDETHLRNIEAYRSLTRHTHRP